MFGFGHTPELIVLLVIAVVIFGPKRLPEIGGAVGKTLRAFRSETTDLTMEATSVHRDVVAALDIDGTATTAGDVESRVETGTTRQPVI